MIGFLTSSKSIQVMIVIAIALLSSLVGVYAGLRGIDYTEIIAIALGVSGILIIVNGEAGIRFGYMFAIGCFVLGYRTVQITPNFLFHPLVALILFLFVLVVINKRRPELPFDVPPILWVLSGFAILGLILGYGYNKPVDLMLASFLNFILIIPVFVLTFYTLRSESFWYLAMTVFLFAGTYIAAFGSIEYLFPEVRNLMPTFIGNAVEAFVDINGFRRAPFVFYGHPVATFICFLSLPFAFPLYKRTYKPFHRVLIVLAVGINLYAIYIGGFRSIWAATGLLFIGLALLQRNRVALIVVIISIVSIFALAPDSAVERFDSLVNAVEGNQIDSSSAERLNRSEDGLGTLLSHPFGSGWGTGGWIHSDFIGIGVDLGIVPGLLFVGWYIYSWGSIIRVYLSKRESRDLALTGAMFGSGVLLLTQPIIIRTQLVVPVWFVWSMVQLRVYQYKAERV